MVTHESPGRVDPNGLILRSEELVGAQLANELVEYFELARDLTALGSDLVERIGQAPGEIRAIHVGAVILARILTDLQACMHLVRHGYAGQAITLVTTMVELMHAGAYIGANEQRADDWLNWSDPKNAYPGLGFAKTFSAVAKNLGVPDDRVRREYETVYQEASMVKHGNPLSMSETNVLTTPGLILAMIGPVPSPEFLWLGHVAMQWATRYALLATVSFQASHVSGEDYQPLLESSVRLSARHAELSAKSARLRPAP